MTIFKFAMATCCLLLIACSFHQSYPPSWSTLVKDSGAECPDLSGRYEDRPIESTRSRILDPNPRSIRDGGGLYDAITRQGIFWGRHSCDDCVTELRWLDDAHDALGIVLRHSESNTKSHLREEMTLHRSRGDFSCTDGGLSVSFTTGFEVVIDGKIVRVHRVFWLTQDGSLVCLEEFREGGHFMTVIPYAGSSEDYVLWQRAQ
jgi:hypothetical protein